MVPIPAMPAIPVVAVEVCVPPQAALMEQVRPGGPMGPRTEGLPPGPPVPPTPGATRSARAKTAAVEGPHVLLLSAGGTAGSAVWWRPESVALEELSGAGGREWPWALGAIWGEVCGEFAPSPL